MSRWVRLRDSRGRDARVRMTAGQREPQACLQAADGRRVEAARFIKTPLPRTYGALSARGADDAELAELLVEEDPEIDIEAAGRRADRAATLLLEQG